MRMVGFARGLFAVAAASLAVLSLSYGDLALIGQSLPAWIPWRETWLYGSALLVLAASALAATFAELIRGAARPSTPSSPCTP